MPETLSTPSTTQIRHELQNLILKDLLGPAGGEEEILEEPYVRKRYINCDDVELPDSENYPFVADGQNRFMIDYRMGCNCNLNI
jgi:hypothetical protein